MVAAMRSANSRQHFIYMLNWWVDNTFDLINDEPGVTLQVLLAQASGRGVMIRAMFWDQQFSLQNNAEADRVTNLNTGAAIVDAPAMRSIGSSNSSRFISVHSTRKCWL